MIRRLFPGACAQPWRTTLAFGLLLVFVAGLRASTQRDLATIPSTDIDVQSKSFATADGFRVNLFAAEPDISKPIHMNFDAAGRLWVAGSSLYPQIRPGAQPIDKIFIVEDTDGDGTVDTSTVFAENLLIPTGLVPDDTVPHLAVYVASSSELLYLEDTDGDGKADRSTVVLSGFGTEDTHHLIHTLRWGPDGHLYFTQSIYIHSHVETPWGVQRLLGGGVWRYHPKTRKLDIFTRGGINMWGHHFDRHGQSFLTDGAGALGINYAFPGATYETAVGAERVLRGLNPGQPKHSGLEIASGRHLPDDWQDRFITADFRGNRINTFRLEDSASGYVSTQAADLLTSTHSAFRPVDVKMGPDGAVYIADWYNPIIQHGEVDFRDPRRDLERGRIWRVAADRPRVAMPDLERAGVDDLLAALEAPELYTRERARPLLARHGADAVLPALGRWVTAAGTNAPSRLLEALWVHQWLDTHDQTLLQTALTSPDVHVRAGAVRVAADWAAHLDDPLTRFARAVADTNARVRLEAVNALRRLGTAEAARVALDVTDQPLDTNLDFAIWLTMRDLAEVWLPRATADPAFFGPDPARLILALRAANRPDALGPLVQLWRSGNIPDALRDDAAQLMAQIGGPAELRLLFNLAQSQASAADRVAIFDALARAAVERKVRPDGSLASLVGIVEGADAEVRAAALRLAGAWQLADARPAMVSAARSDASVLRTAGLQALADLGPSSQPVLEEIATSGPPAHRADAIGALARLDVAAAATIAAGLLASPEGADTAAIAGAFLTREAGPAALAASLTGRSIPPATGRAVLRAAAASGRNLPDLVRAVESAAGLDALATMPAGDALRALIETVRTDGDAARGERVYHRRELACAACHAIAGAGGQVGPDLVSIGASAPLDYIVQALLDPQATVKEGFQVTTVTRADGSIAAGILLREGGGEIVLRDAANVEHRVALSQVRSREISPVSLMPPGLTSSLREDELVDLLAFLSQLGREGGVTVPNVPYVRRYELLEAGNATSALLRSTSMGAAAQPGMQGLTWHPVYARVDGSLPTSEIPVGTPTIAYFGDQRFRVARFELDVARGGDVALAFDDPAGLTVYVAGERLPETHPVTTFALPAGRHTITVVLDLLVRGTGTALRVRLADAGAKAAQVQAVSGG